MTELTNECMRCKKFRERLATARGILGDLFSLASEAGLDQSGTEDYVRQEFGEWIERVLREDGISTITND